MTSDGDLGDINAFLQDGLGSPPGPAALLVGEADTCVQYAASMHEHGVLAAPSERGLLSLDGAKMRTIDVASMNDIFDQFESVGAWVFVADLHTHLDTAGGRALLSVLRERLGRGRLRCVVAGTTPAGLQRIRSEAIRIVGFMPVVDLSRSPERATPAISYLTMIGQNLSAEDRGWMISVKYSLAQDVVPPGGQQDDPEADNVLSLVESVGFVGSGVRPTGLLLSLSSTAFTASQQAPAFRAAEVAARRVVGRRMLPGESAEAVRGVCFT